MKDMEKFRVVATYAGMYPRYWDFFSQEDAESFIPPDNPRNVEVIHGNDYDLDLDMYVRKQNMIRYTDLVTPPQLNMFQYIKARISCFFHGHVWEYNGVKHACSLLINGDMDEWVCTRCGKKTFFK